MSLMMLKQAAGLRRLGCREMGIDELMKTVTK